MLYGLGSSFIATRALGANSLIGANIMQPQCLAGVSFESQTQEQTAECYRNGILQTVASAITAENFTITATYNFLSFSTLEMLYGELSQTGGGVVPTLANVVIGATAGDLTQAFADLSAVNGASFKAYDATNDIFLTPSATATPGVNQFFVDAPNSQLIFNASQQNTEVAVSYDKIYTSIQSIGSGGETDRFDALTNLSFSAIVSSAVEGADAYLLHVPRIERVNTPTLNIAGGNRAEFSIQYRCINLPGRRKPFTLYRLANATV